MAAQPISPLKLFAEEKPPQQPSYSPPLGLRLRAIFSPKARQEIGLRSYKGQPEQPPRRMRSAMRDMEK